jgi:hypothetical protein
MCKTAEEKPGTHRVLAYYFRTAINSPRKGRDAHKIAMWIQKSESTTDIIRLKKGFAILLD